MGSFFGRSVPLFSTSVLYACLSRCSMTPYRFVPHTADIAVELVAPDEAGLRAAGLDALRGLLLGSSAVRALEERPIEAPGKDAGERPVRFLRAPPSLSDAGRV